MIEAGLSGPRDVVHLPGACQVKSYSLTLMTFRTLSIKCGSVL